MLLFDHMKKRLEFYKNNYINYINKKSFYFTGLLSTEY